MNRLISIFGLCAGIALISTCASPRGASSSKSPSAMIAAARDLDERFIAAFNKGDVDGVMATYWNSPDVVLYSPDELECHGWASIKESMLQMAGNPNGLDLQLVDPHYMIAGDCVISWGKWRMKGPGEDGSSEEAMGRYTDVKAKRDGKWVYVIDHASMAMPADE